MSEQKPEGVDFALNAELGLNLADDPAYRKLDELYRRGWKDRHDEKDYDPRGTRQWQDVMDVIETYGKRLDAAIALLIEARAFVKPEASWHIDAERFLRPNAELSRVAAKEQSHE